MSVSRIIAGLAAATLACGLVIATPGASVAQSAGCTGEPEQ